MCLFIWGYMKFIIFMSLLNKTPVTLPPSSMCWAHPCLSSFSFGLLQTPQFLVSPFLSVIQLYSPSKIKWTRKSCFHLTSVFLTGWCICSAVLATHKCKPRYVQLYTYIIMYLLFPTTSSEKAQPGTIKCCWQECPGPCIYYQKG